VAIICIREGHWRKLCQAMGTPELGADERFASAALRSADLWGTGSATEAATTR
jgi:crotonobetainyl-CoA:carnitine CoA-transferase CaiB-like acyl-CoA transferase